MKLPQPLPEIEIADFETELVVLVPGQRRAHLLEPLVALLFDSCRAGHDLDEVVEEVNTATGWPVEDTRAWLSNALRSLQRSGIVAMQP